MHCFAIPYLAALPHTGQKKPVFTIATLRHFQCHVLTVCKLVWSGRSRQAFHVNRHDKIIQLLTQMRRSSQLKQMHIYRVYLHSSSGRYFSTQFNLIVIFKRRDGYRTIRYGRNGKASHCVPSSIVYCAKRRPTLIADFVAVSHAFQGYHYFLWSFCAF